MNKSYKYRFQPTESQKLLLAQTFGSVRVVYNHILNWRSKEYSQNNPHTRKWVYWSTK